MKLKISTLFVAAALVLGIQTAAWAVPSTIPYQGRLTDAGGTPINTAQSIRFSLKDAATAGTELWFEVQPAVTVANGLFNVDLGSVTPIPAGVFSGADVWLEIKVGTDAAMTPRIKLGSVAYCMRAGSVDPASRAGVSTLSQSTSGFLPNGANAIVSRTVTFPGPGTAVVSWTWTWETDHSNGTTDFGTLGISETSTAIDAGTGHLLFTLVSGDASGLFRLDTTPTTRAFAIGAAGTHTYYGNFNKNAGSFYNWYSNFIIEFFPDAIGAISEPQVAPSAAIGTAPVPRTLAEKAVMEAKQQK